MIPHNPFSIITLLLSLLLFYPTPTSASLFTSNPPPLFCKCTCGSNSTIIPLSSPPPPPPDPPSTHKPSYPLLFLRDGSGGGGGGSGGARQTCADCTRSYCLGYNLPICKDIKKEEDVITSCFARDSVGDRVIVWGFVVVTGGLLAWAGVRRWVGRMWEGRGWSGLRGEGGRGYFSVGR